MHETLLELSIVPAPERCVRGRLYGFGVNSRVCCCDVIQASTDDDVGNLSEDSQIALLKQRCESLEALIHSKEEVSSCQVLVLLTCRTLRQKS
jgi:hypothetical protein